MGVWRIALAGRMLGVDEFRNIFTISSNTLPAVEDIAGWFNGMYDSSFLAHINNSFSTEKLIIEEPAGDGLWQYRTETPFVKVGTASTDSLPLQSAAVVIGITASRRRGKKFLVGTLESESGFGIIGSALRTALETWAGKYILPSTVDAGYLWESGVCRKEGTDFLPFLSYRVDTILGTQRRRKQGVGS